jgi:hypothetical protein
MLHVQQGILTPDHEFFQGEALAKLRDQALIEHRAGQTTPWLGTHNDYNIFASRK